MGFERLDGTSGGVAVDIWRDEKVSAVPVFLDDAFVFGTGFVVEDLGSDGVSARLETVHDGVVGGNLVFVLAGLEGGLEDGVGVAVVGDHDVLIAATGADGEASGVVCVQLFDGLDLDVDFVGAGRRAGCWQRQREHQGLELGGPDALP